MGGRRGIARESECFGRDFPAVAWNRERDGANAWRERRANQVDGRSTLAVHPLAIGGIERPGTVKFEPAARADAHFVYLDWIERLDGMNTNVGEARR